MKRSNRLILLIGVFLAALAFVFIVIILGGGGGGAGSAQATAVPSKLPTVVAARDIPLGVAVTSDMLTTRTLSTDVRLPGVYGDPTQVAGQVARTNIKKDQQVTPALFTDTGASARVDCPAGFTCMAVQVDQVSGVGTLIKSGDHVDVVAQISPKFPLNYFVGSATTPTSNAEGTGALYDTTSVKMLLQGLQVVATLLPPPPTAATGAAASAAPAPAAGTTALNGQQEIVIIAVTAAQAEVIKFAQLDGNITLSLRSPKDFVDANNVPIVPVASATTGLVLKTMIDTWGVVVPQAIVVPAPAPAR
ncbi:MAG: Flp pilus assembly protein CpaB [Chloroflexi bacterium]|nr:Flp pilus assembly protein CpaB [Chloroflexota bacterium]